MVRCEVKRVQDLQKLETGFGYGFVQLCVRVCVCFIRECVGVLREGKKNTITSTRTHSENILRSGANQRVNY